MFQDGKDLLRGASSKSPTVMGKDTLAVDADRQRRALQATNFISDRMDES